jgi:hypothetical protein
MHALFAVFFTGNAKWDLDIYLWVSIPSRTKLRLGMIRQKRVIQTPRSETHKYSHKYFYRYSQITGTHAGPYLVPIHSMKIHWNMTYAEISCGHELKPVGGWLHGF